jgi:hypothetical protein
MTAELLVVGRGSLLVYPPGTLERTMRKAGHRLA